MLMGAAIIPEGGHAGVHLAFIIKDLSSDPDLEYHWNVVCLTKRNQGWDSWAPIDADSSA